MKKIFLSLMVVLMGSLLTVPDAGAQNRRGGRNAAGSSQSVSRPGRGNREQSGSRPSYGNVRPGNSGNNNGSYRPGNNAGGGNRLGQGVATPPGGNNNNNYRPGHNGGGNRPGQGVATPPGGNNNNNYRPGHNGGGNRPGQGVATPPGGNNNNNYRPGHNGGGNRPGQGVATPPGGNNNNNYRPGHNGGGNRPGHGNYAPPSRPHLPPRPVGPSMGHRPGHRPPVMAPPTRPGRPYYAIPWTRPIPPSGWRPVYRRPLLPNFLGLTFGLTINTALDRLYDSGYAVDGYGSQEVYLRNVAEMGYSWDDATLYFASGGLVRSQFFESSAGYNPSRYNNVYMSLCNSYGAPVNRSNNSATWFGYNGDYITLQYTMMNTSVGYRYFTILTYGN